MNVLLHIRLLEYYVLFLQDQIKDKDYMTPSLRASSLGSGGTIGGKMERELAATSQQFKYPYRKFQCKMLIGGHLIW